MSSDEIEEIKNSVDIVEVIQNFVDLEYRGSYFTGICPFHSSNSLNVFKVYPNKGYYRCFSCQSSGDSIQFLKAMGNTFKETLQILKGEKEINGNVVSKASPKAPVAEFVYIKPTHRFTLEDYKHSKHGYPDNVYEYFNEDNEFIGSVLRFNLPDGSKYTPPFNSRICIKEGYRSQKNGVGKGKYYKIGDIESTFSGFGFYPIYGIEKLKMYPNAKVLIGEGEKVKSTIESLFNPKELIALSLIGGVNNVDKTDLSDLKGRVIILCNDNDNVGREFMSKLASKLTSNNVVYMTEYPESLYEKAWDVSDTDWNNVQMKEFFNKYAKLIV